MRKKSGFIDISFNWIFSLIVGAFILFMAIFIAVKITNIERVSQGAQTSKDIGILLSPLETGFETSIATTLILPSETIIQTDCNEFGNFGNQIIKTFQKKPLNSNQVSVSFQNKYIMSEKTIEGKNFYVFSMPFNFPFKVASLTYLIPVNKEYCFVKAPENIIKELNDLEINNILNSTRAGDCNEDSVSVCFQGAGGCSINVRSDYIEKNNKRVYFEGNELMYASIFSDPDIYECQLVRLMKRTSKLTSLYEDKAVFIAQKCNTNINFDEFKALVDSFENSQDLNNLEVESSILTKSNDVANCKLW